jgi:hypothetical protein
MLIRQLGAAFEKRDKLVPPELAPQYGLAVGVDTMNLNNVLGDIDADIANFKHGWLLLLRQGQSIKAHRDAGTSRSHPHH